MTYWVTRRKMLEFLDRLKRPAHRDYDVIREIEQHIEDYQDEEELLAAFCSASGFEYDEIDQVADDLKERNAIFDLVEEQESAAFGDDEQNLVERVKNGLADANQRSEAYWDIRVLCVDAGLIRPGDRETDIVPLLRMFLPIEGLPQSKAPPAPPPPPDGRSLFERMAAVARASP